MINIVGQGASTLKVESRVQSTVFYLVPMGVSLMACCMLLTLVYCVTRGERAEDEHISKVLAGLRNGKQEPNKVQQVQAQRPQIKLPEEPSRPTDSASESSSGSTEATTAAIPEPEEESEKQESEEDEAASEEGIGPEAENTGDSQQAEAANA
jgi:hypothetical protein